MKSVFKSQSTGAISIFELLADLESIHEEERRREAKEWMQQKRKRQQEAEEQEAEEQEAEEQEAEEQEAEEQEAEEQEAEEQEKDTPQKGIGFICNQCKKNYKTQRGLKNHLRFTHSQEKPYRCDECDRSYKRQATLVYHKKSIHTTIPRNRLRCDKCDSTCATERQLKTHVKLVHPDSLTFCNECNKPFKSKKTLQKHMKLHTGNKPYVCAVCLATFVGSQSLKEHARIHTGEKPYKCSTCSAAFAFLSNLKVHTRVHTGERPYICDICQHASIDQGGLIEHRRTHSQERPYVCTICSVACKSRSNLKNHMRKHTNPKVFSCSHCTHTTIWKNSLRQHEKMHEIQSKYKYACDMQDGGTQPWTEGDVHCSIRCKTPYDLQVHIQRNHTAEGIRDKLESERKLDQFFAKNDVPRNRDWQNYIGFATCKNILDQHKSARIDFFLIAESARLGCLVFVENNEQQHKTHGASYACELQRIFNCANALEQTDEYRGAKILFINFNPHTYRRNRKQYDPKLTDAHKILLQTIRNLQPEDIREGVNLIYIHYDETNGELDIFRDPENDFATIYRDCVIKHI